uniref:Ribosomal RNA small subunit methyltransferase I n=1 Tax=Cyanothece sp. (strain PCC 7425 / ATCC 29141) TaxID=395961 RepID=B8HQC4_CYAP4
MKSAPTAQPGTLYIVATPIGNLEDMSFRAVRILQSVDLIAAEDTRHTGKLLQHFQIDTPQLSFFSHNIQQRLPELLQRLQQRQAIALVTDAGMPTIADPGYELVCACVAAEIPVVPIPGANAALTALSAAGLPTGRFVFEGFLPSKGQERRDRLEALGRETRTIVLYEAPHRLLQTLTDLLPICTGDRSVVAARELTKMHEQFWRGTLAEAIAHYTQTEPKGEFTLVIAGAEIELPTFSPEALKIALTELLQQGLSRSQASRQLAEQTQLSRREIYQLALTLPGDNLTDLSSN